MAWPSGAVVSIGRLAFTLTIRAPRLRAALMWDPTSSGCANAAIAAKRPRSTFAGRAEWPTVNARRERVKS
jgi:hypothetical protein